MTQSPIPIGTRVRVIFNARARVPAIDPRWIGVEGRVIETPLHYPVTPGLRWIALDPHTVDESLPYNQQPFFEEELQVIPDDDTLLQRTLSLAEITRDDAAMIISWALTAWDERDIHKALRSFSDPETLALTLSRAAKAYFADDPTDKK